MEYYKREWPELVGKKIKWYSELREFKGVVAGCDYDVGLTIKNVAPGPGYEEEYLTCLPHPALKPAEKLVYVTEVKSSDMRLEIYDRLFEYCVGMIITGVFDGPTSNRVCEEMISEQPGTGGGEPSEENCAFGS